MPLPPLPAVQACELLSIADAVCDEAPVPRGQLPAIPQARRPPPVDAGEDAGEDKAGVRAGTCLLCTDMASLPMLRKKQKRLLFRQGGESQIASDAP